MTSDGLSRSDFDPRRHAAVAISITERKPVLPGARSHDVHVKHYMVGPNVPPPGLSLRRPASAPLYRAKPDGTLKPTPTLLTRNGTWSQDCVPALISNSQAQPLTVTDTLTARVAAAGDEGRAIRPVVAIHTYNDVSPVVQADMVRDTDLDLSTIKASLRQRPRTAVSGSLRTSQTAANVPTVASILDKAARHTATQPHGTIDRDATDARRKSIDSFWARQEGTAFNLGIADLQRTQALGRNVAPGSANTRLVGGKWRYIPRPTEGDVIYTDYYGRCGEALDDYYGRAYHLQAAQFTKSRLVGDADYVKIRASMQGIQALRERPGLTMDAAIVHGAQGQLHDLTALTAQTSRSVHKLREFGRLRPASARMLREVWQD